jgi:hypothetical protein
MFIYLFPALRVDCPPKIQWSLTGILVVWEWICHLGKEDGVDLRSEEIEEVVRGPDVWPRWGFASPEDEEYRDFTEFRLPARMPLAQLNARDNAGGTIESALGTMPESKDTGIPDCPPESKCTRKVLSFISNPRSTI